MVCKQAVGNQYVPVVKKRKKQIVKRVQREEFQDEILLLTPTKGTP